MHPLYSEYLMGHRSGLTKSYYKPLDTELLEGSEKALGYVAATPELTIYPTEEENQRLRTALVEEKLKNNRIEKLAQQIEEVNKKLGLPSIVK
jgi:hypothetical protein